MGLYYKRVDGGSYLIHIYIIFIIVDGFPFHLVYSCPPPTGVPECSECHLSTHIHCEPASEDALRQLAYDPDLRYCVSGGPCRPGKGGRDLKVVTIR